MASLTGYKVRVTILRVHFRARANPMKSRHSQNLSAERLALLEKRMIAYTLGATGALAVAQPANASIVFTKTNQTISSGMVLNIDLNKDGIPDFTLRNYETGYSSLYVSHLTVSGGAVGSGKVIGQKVLAQASAWDAPAGWPIGPNSPKGFVSVQGQRAEMLQGLCLFQCYPHGFWAKATNKFLGFQFTVNGQIHYGWARLSTSLQKSGLTATLTGYAYETQAGTAIAAGDRGFVAQSYSADALSTEPTLALLSLGSAGLDVWRREN
jgi:hypothetical protein